MKFRTPRLLAAAALAAGVAAVGFTQVATAGGEEPAAPLTIVKMVEGPVPAGTTFTVTVQCDGSATFEGGSQTAEVTFDATGQPTSPDTLYFIDGPGSCVATETANSGAATTTYACEGGFPVDEEPVGDSADVFPTAEVLDQVCASAGPQATPITMHLVSPSQEVTITVHNTFVAPQPAAQVVAQPAFTG